MGMFSCTVALVLFFLLALCSSSAEARIGFASTPLSNPQYPNLPSKHTATQGGQLKHGAVFIIPNTDQLGGDGQVRGDSDRPELRWVPSGPDPMHHHSSPEKPKITP